jgi:predicted kinase
VHIEVDALFELLRPQSDRGRADRMLAYDAAHLLTRMLVERGDRVVLECTYARAEQRASLVDALAHVPEAPLWVVECHVSADDAVRRFRSRDEPTDLDAAALRERAESFPYLDQALRLMSAEATPAELAEHVAAWLRDVPAPVPREVWARAGRAWDSAGR